MTTSTVAPEPPEPADPAVERAALQPLVAAVTALAAEVRRGFEAARPAEDERAMAAAWSASPYADSVISWSPVPEPTTRCCVCGSAAARPRRGVPFCPDCADCGCNQSPCVRTGINAPAVSGEAASPAGTLRDQIAGVLAAAEGRYPCTDSDQLADSVLLVIEQHTARLRSHAAEAAAQAELDHAVLVNTGREQAAAEAELRRVRALHDDTVRRLRADLAAAVERAEAAETQLQRGRDAATQLEPESEAELREQIAAAARTVQLHLGPNAVDMAQRGEAIILSMSEADTLAAAVLPTVRFALDAWHKAHTRAAQVEELLNIAHQTSNTSETARAEAEAQVELTRGELVNARRRASASEAELLRVQALHTDTVRQLRDENAAAVERAEAAEQQLAVLQEQGEQLAAEAARRTEAAIAIAVPVLSRALGQLPETCRYHGGQLEADHHRRRYGSEACCDTGIPALRRLLAVKALASLTANLKES